MTRYGQSALRWPFVGAIASSIACLITIGIASESAVITNAQTRPTVTSRHCSRHSLTGPFAVGQRPRSGGSTERNRRVTLSRYQRVRRRPLTRLSGLGPCEPASEAAAGGGPAESLHHPAPES